MLPDPAWPGSAATPSGLNAPTGAWCSLTLSEQVQLIDILPSQCTYRCVVLPDRNMMEKVATVLFGLNAPTGAWCSLTLSPSFSRSSSMLSQCTYRCVVLPDGSKPYIESFSALVSMHLQVRGAP